MAIPPNFKFKVSLDGTALPTTTFQAITVPVYVDSDAKDFVEWARTSCGIQSEHEQAFIFRLADGTLTSDVVSWENDHLPPLSYWLLGDDGYEFKRCFDRVDCYAENRHGDVECWHEYHEAPPCTHAETGKCDCWARQKG